MKNSYFILDAKNTNPKRIQTERDKARKFKKTNLWHQKAQKGCFYCFQLVPIETLTLDHIVPLARGGQSTPGNMVPACKSCQISKKLETPVEQILNDTI